MADYSSSQLPDFSSQSMPVSGFYMNNDSTSPTANSNDYSTDMGPRPWMQNMMQTMQDLQMSGSMQPPVVPPSMDNSIYSSGSIQYPLLSSSNSVQAPVFPPSMDNSTMQDPFLSSSNSMQLDMIEGVDFSQTVDYSLV